MFKSKIRKIQVARWGTQKKTLKKDFYSFIQILDASVTVVKMDSRSWSFCLHHYVQNNLSYPGKETQPMLCINDAKLRSSFIDLRRNKHQLLHRFTSIKTPQIYNITWA